MVDARVEMPSLRMKLARLATAARGGLESRLPSPPRTPTTIIFKKLNPDSALRCVLADDPSLYCFDDAIKSITAQCLGMRRKFSPLARNIRWASMSRAQSAPSSANPRTVIGWSSDLSTPEVCDAPEQVALIGYAAHKPSFISSF